MSKEEDLEWTGERLVTQVTNLHGTIEHLHRYAIALSYANNKVVLDIACGEGYGSGLLATKANKVFGVDISSAAVKHARKKYKLPNLEFRVGSTSKIPIDDFYVDLVISFETIEHHDAHDEMMKEISRVLKPGGMLIISSPEKSIYKERDPNNPFHIKELELNELQKLLQKYFKHLKIYTQQYVTGSMITLNDLNQSGTFGFYDGDFKSIKQNLDPGIFYNIPYFNVVLCSNRIIDISNEPIEIASFFNGYKIYESEMNELRRIYDSDISKTRNLYMKSVRYKLGNFILKPLYLIKTLCKLGDNNSNNYEK